MFDHPQKTLKIFAILSAMMILFLPITARAQLKQDWVMTYGGKGDDIARSLTTTSEGGFIMAGHSDSFSDNSGGCLHSKNKQKRLYRMGTDYRWE